MSNPEAVAIFDSYDPTVCTTRELWWRDHYDWLTECGYFLSGQYDPNTNPVCLRIVEDPEMCEDDPSFWATSAVREPDYATVCLRRVKKSEHPDLVPMSQYLLSKPLADDPRNHSCPLYEVLQVSPSHRGGDFAVLVTPALVGSDDRYFTTVAQVMEYLRQVIEGLQFMHSQNIAYGQITSHKVLFHPRDAIRCVNEIERPTKYYLSDFRDSHKYDSDDGGALDKALSDGDGSALKCWPKPQGLEDPFLVDVYFLGRMISKEIIQRYTGLDFLKPFAEEMVIMDPLARPTVHKVAERLGEILQSLSSEELCSSLVCLRPSPWMIPYFRSYPEEPEA